MMATKNSATKMQGAHFFAPLTTRSRRCAFAGRSGGGEGQSRSTKYAPHFSIAGFLGAHSLRPPARCPEQVHHAYLSPVFVRQPREPIAAPSAAPPGKPAEPLRKDPYPAVK